MDRIETSILELERGRYLAGWRCYCGRSSGREWKSIELAESYLEAMRAQSARCSGAIE